MTTCPVVMSKRSPSAKSSRLTEAQAEFIRGYNVLPGAVPQVFEWIAKQYDKQFGTDTKDWRDMRELVREVLRSR